ncbi:MAG: hypothetical protein LC800_21635 [Acidobacteria bacterium]|nr:hypothetical protein [Acidobacteriota bacterium]
MKDLSFRREGNFSRGLGRLLPGLQALGISGPQKEKTAEQNRRQQKRTDRGPEFNGRTLPAVVAPGEQKILGRPAI